MNDVKFTSEFDIVHWTSQHLILEFSRMRNLKLTLAYDGTDFHGWQIQPHLRTIQGELQQALRKLFNHDVKVIGSGRTDAGVHAHGQVANVQTVRAMETGAVLRGANALLPPEIRVLGVDDVAPEFHARRSARSKTYEYRVCRDAVVCPFRCRYAFAFRYPICEEAVDRGTLHFLGTHDFTSFCATATEVEDRRRTIYEAAWERSGTEWVFRIRGNGFLQYMVRTITGTLLEIGRKRIRPEQVPEIFAARDRRLAGPSLPTHGLHLMGVEY
jgi:tRNA pseudouridine38-40 synthase